MKIYLKALEPGVWNAVITNYIPPKRIRTPAQNKAKKNNANAIEAILDGISQSIEGRLDYVSQPRNSGSNWKIFIQMKR